MVIGPRCWSRVSSSLAAAVLASESRLQLANGKDAEVLVFDLPPLD